MFTCDEEALRRHDGTFSNVSDAKDVEPEVLHSVLSFIDSNVQSGDVASVEVPTDVKDSLTTETTTSSADIISDATSNSDLDLRRTGQGIREQCKMITDLSYQMDDADTGAKVLAQLCDVYKAFYAACQNESGLVPLRKDDLKFRTLSGKRRNKGFFQRRRIIPLYPSKNRRFRLQKTSRFGKRPCHSETTTSDDGTTNDVEMAMEPNQESPFISLEAYKGQDVRHAKGLGTPGLLCRSE